jgi:hypothetical protein
MVPEMMSFWETTTSNKITSDLKEIFEPQVRLMGHECLDEFLSCKMEEHGCVGLHLVKMLRIHMRLTVELEFDLLDDIVESVVLRSLPPSYKCFIKRFLRKAEPVNLHQLMARIRLHDEDIPTTQPSPPTIDDPIVADQDKSNDEIMIGPITRARAKLSQQQVNSLLAESDIYFNENFILPKSLFICMIRFIGEEGV